MKKMEKVEGPDADKSEKIKLEFLMDTDIQASRYTQQFANLKYIMDAQRNGSSG
jgi:hypothetical protein